MGRARSKQARDRQSRSHAGGPGAEPCYSLNIQSLLLPFRAAARTGAWELVGFQNSAVTRQAADTAAARPELTREESLPRRHGDVPASPHRGT